MEYFDDEENYREQMHEMPYMKKKPFKYYRGEKEDMEKIRER